MNEENQTNALPISSAAARVARRHAEAERAVLEAKCAARVPVAMRPQQAGRVVQAMAQAEEGLWAACRALRDAGMDGHPLLERYEAMARDAEQFAAPVVAEVYF